MRIKSDVRILGLRPEILLALQVAQSIYLQHSLPLTLTSVMEGVHSTGSLHYAGCAIDISLPDLPNSTTNSTIHAQLCDSLTRDFDCILEGNHIHIEYQPKAAY